MKTDIIEGCIAGMVAILVCICLQWALKCDCKAILRHWSVIKPLLLSILCLWAISILSVVTIFIGQK